MTLKRQRAAFTLLAQALLCSLALLVTVGAQISSNAKTNQTLIVVDKTTSVAAFQQSHSELVNLIQSLGYTVVIKGADDSAVNLSQYGEYLYDNIILFCPTVNSFRAGITKKDILEFIDAQNNLILIGNSNPGTIISQLANEVGFQFKSAANERVYTTTKLRPLLYITGDIYNYSSQSFSYSGAQFKMLNNELTIDLLTNSAPVDDLRLSSSSSKFINNILIGVMQARNNARVAISGSIDFFNNAALSDPKIANKHFTVNLLQWVFKEKSLLRFSDVQHKKLNVDPTPSTDISTMTNFEGYTINDDVEYSIKIEIYENRKWLPYTADDVQLEFVRIDPFIRQTMVRENDKYVARFKVPDVYGVYKFQVDYQRQGLTHLLSSTQVSIRPLRHNEYERFIYSAYPYYLSAFLMIIYLYIFSFVYLYQRKDNDPKSFLVSKEALKEKIK